MGCVPTIKLQKQGARPLAKELTHERVPYIKSLAKATRKSDSFARP